MTPSKELMSEVLGDGVVTKIGDLYGSELFYHSDKSQYQPLPYSINIYEFAHKCKDWADSNCYTLLVGKDTLENHKDGDYVCFIKTQTLLSYVTIIQTFGADTEEEAIFKACEWIMEQTKC